MKIALIGDVHANLPALEAVLAHAAAEGAQAVWNIGDMVGYNAFPEEVVRMLREREDVTSILGNYDQKALKAPDKVYKWAGNKDPRKVRSFLWSYEQLSQDSRAYLRSLPEQRDLMAEGWRVLLAHGSPASINEHLFTDTPEERMCALAAMTAAQIIVIGHSHQPFLRPVEETWFINTGSVGRPDDGDPRASYALLELLPGVRACQHYRIDYDVERAARAILERGLPPEFAEMIRQGRNLDSVDNSDGNEP